MRITLAFTRLVNSICKENASVDLYHYHSTLAADLFSISQIFGISKTPVTVCKVTLNASLTFQVSRCFNQVTLFSSWQRACKEVVDICVVTV